MSKEINKHYRLEFEPIESDEQTDQIETWIATDVESHNQDLVRIKLVHKPKQDDLIHSIFMSLAYELTQIEHPGLSRLLDFGFDGRQSIYYLVWEHLSGKPLSHVVSEKPLSKGLILEILQEVSMAVNYLHLRQHYYGSITLANVLMQHSGELPLVLLETGASHLISILLGDDLSDFREMDITAVGMFAESLITGEESPNDQQTMEALRFWSPKIRDVISQLASRDDQQYKSLAATIRDICEISENSMNEDIYYLEVTKKCAKRLYDFGFISYDEKHLAAELLNDELSHERHGLIKQQGKAPSYYITTRRFRLLCVPAHDRPGHHLVITNVECPTNISLVTDREKGLPIRSSLYVTSNGQAPLDADVTPLLNALKEHQLEAHTRRVRETEYKDTLSIWSKVHQLQRRLLAEFQLEYSSWQFDSDSASIKVELAREVEDSDFSEDDRFRMSRADGHGHIAVGFFEDLDGKLLKLGLAKNVDIDRIADQGFLMRDDIQVRSILARQEDAIKRVKYRESLNPKLGEFLVSPNTLQSRLPQDVVFFDDMLDESQQQSVKKALSINDLFLIQGPPGTGKTTAIVELVRQILNYDRSAHRVLIASQSNVAVNHALQSLLQNDPGLKEFTIRIGREEKADDTQDLLLDYQLSGWAEDVVKKSKKFIEQEQAKLTLDSRLAECINLLDEHSEKEGKINSLIKELKEAEDNYEVLAAQYDSINAMLNEIETVKSKAMVVQNQVSESDSTLNQILKQFDTDFIQWSHRFLMEVSELSQISGRKNELSQLINQRRASIQSIEDDLESARLLIQETLADVFNVNIGDTQSQKSYIDSNLKQYQSQAIKLARIKKVAQDWWVKIDLEPNELSRPFLNRCKVIGATCIGIAARGEASDVDFDWVIIDEAGRATPPELLVPMVRGRKIVLVGDHRQLPPIVERDITNELLEEIEIERKDLQISLFEHLIGGLDTSVQGQLLVQYRMHPTIGGLISQSFYQGELINGVSEMEKNHGLKSIQRPVQWINTNGAANHFETPMGYSYQNLHEQEIIIDILDNLEVDLRTNNVRKSVGIITGYMAQKHLLRDRIMAVSQNRWSNLDIEIGTVDAYQGREMDFVIYSVVRSNSERKIGFLRDERRLNVALSRAKELLIIVGDRRTAEYAVSYGKPNPFIPVINFISTHPSECEFGEPGL